MRWMLGATVQRRHRLDMMTTSLLPPSLHATVREPLGLVAEISVKVTAETAGLLSGKSAVPAVEEQSIRIP